MTHQEAADLLNITDSSTPAEIQANYQNSYNQLQMLLNNAPTPNLKKLYQRNLQELEEAYGLLTTKPAATLYQDLPSATPVYEVPKEFVKPQNDPVLFADQVEKLLESNSAGFRKKEPETAFDKAQKRSDKISQPLPKTEEKPRRAKTSWLRNGALILGIILMTLIFLNNLSSDEARAITYESVKQLIKDHQVAEVVIYQDKKAEVTLTQQAAQSPRYRNLFSAKPYFGNSSPHFKADVKSAESVERDLASLQKGFSEDEKIDLRFEYRNFLSRNFWGLMNRPRELTTRRFKKMWLAKEVKTFTKVSDHEVEITLTQQALRSPKYRNMFKDNNTFKEDNAGPHFYLQVTSEESFIASMIN